MESATNEASRKRMKPDAGEKQEDHISNGTVMEEIAEKEQSEAIIVGSEEMELNISHIFEKIERFTQLVTVILHKQLVSELLESGKSMFKELSNDFEERLIMIHKEQMEKWQEEIKELRLIDASNEEATALLSNARFLLQNPFSES
ncbi:knotted 1-binding protein [Gossypium australe]|uniref:Knotted 1-binding protein n=1 Tax=Gossypium australe TaxID=47621 RepID=A0A5B6UX07_9ROSI|nr:knotted 1-binding protein [Gossypium australe]